MSYYDVYVQYFNQKISEYNEESDKLKAEPKSENDYEKKSRISELSYFTKTAENVLKELEDRREWYIDDGHGNGRRFIEYLKKEQHFIDNSIGYDRFYICYDLGHPEEYSSNPEWEAESDFYRMALSELPDWLIESEPKGYFAYGLKCLRENIAFFDDLSPAELSNIKRLRPEEISSLSQDDKDFLEKIEKRLYLFKELYSSLGLNNSLVDKIRYCGDYEYAGEDFSDRLEYWKIIHKKAWDDPKSSYIFGMAILEGKFSKALITLGYDYLYKAAEKGHTEAKYQCGICWLYGEGGRFAYLKNALDFFEEAARLSHKKAAELLKKYSSEEGEKLWYKEIMQDKNGNVLWHKDSRLSYEHKEKARNIRNLDAIYEFAKRLAVEEYDAFHFNYGFADEAALFYEFILRNREEKKAALALAELYEKGGINLQKDFDKAKKYREMADKF